MATPSELTDDSSSIASFLTIRSTSFQDPIAVDHETGEESASTPNQSVRSSSVDFARLDQQRLGRHDHQIRRSIPEWFLQNNVRTLDEIANRPSNLRVYDAIARPTNRLRDASKTSKQERYAIHNDLYTRLQNTIHAGMLVPGLADDLASFTSCVILQCPTAGSQYFLEAVVESLAKDVQTELVSVNIQDFAELGGDMFPSLRAPLAGLEYSLFGDRSPSSGWFADHVRIPDQVFREISDGLINACWRKRLEDDRNQSISQTDDNGEEWNSPKLLIHIQDFDRFNSSKDGRKFLEELHGLVRQERERHRPILLIFTAPSLELHRTVGQLPSPPPRSETTGLDVATPSASYGMIVKITHSHTLKQEAVLAVDGSQWTRDTNVRNIKYTMKHLISGGDLEHITSSTSWDLKDFPDLITSLEATVWEREQVAKVAIEALGKARQKGSLKLEDVAEIVRGIEAASGIIKYTPEYQLRRSSRDESGEPTSSARKVDEVIEAVTNGDDQWEKNLLSAIVRPETVNASSENIRMSTVVLSRMRRLINPWLTRRNIYGVLAKGRIPGVLLYGPPGTGKTLLAKVVAKESGATMLEVSGADVLQSYSGESEKTIRAMFSLARKLSPCVIFIDEADSMFRARSSNEVSWVRSQTNQFLREWEGLSSDQGAAFIMIATNRPWDIDDAVLRRLPSRIHIGLPGTEDRAAILTIYLEDEILGQDVTIDDLANATQRYSGSDLKNLCVEAALICADEESRSAPMVEPGGGNRHRILRWEHFKRAMKEIKPTVRQHMLDEIRAFQQKYGLDGEAVLWEDENQGSRWIYMARSILARHRHKLLMPCLNTRQDVQTVML